MRGRHQERSAARAAEYAVGTYTDIAEMLVREPLDLVSACLPNKAHYRPALLVIDAGVFLIVENPQVFPLDEADHLLAEGAKCELFFQ